MSEGPPPTLLPPLPPRTGWLDRMLPASVGDSAGRGIAVALLAAFAGLVVALSCLFIPVVGQWLCVAFAGFPGLSQLAWIVPLDRWAARRGRSQLRKGLWIGAAVVFALNGSCWGTVLGGRWFR